jgi:phosphatidate phosphatase APP1
MNHTTKLICVGFALMASLPAIAPGQSFQAAVSGIVTDPTGAVVPKVKITVMDTERGVSFSTVTNQDGVYLINNLIPSTYTMTAEAQGFQTHQLTSFPLTAKQDLYLTMLDKVGRSDGETRR